MKGKLKKNSFIQGTLISSFFMIFIKILGALYVIPFYKIIGEEGGTLYSYAYNIYILFLNISTAGIPVAMSMIISEYLALEMYDAKQRAKKIGSKLVGVLAVVSFLIVFFGSKNLASFLLSDVSGGHTVNEVATVIRVTSFCLLIIPFLSILRGYLQGHKYITVTSFSQVLEQIVRIVVVLLGSYVSIRILKHSTEVGVSVALTGAFFGGLAAFIYLKLKIRNNKKEFVESKTKDNVKNKEILRKIISYCVPIVMISIIDNIYTLIDIRLIVKGLSMAGYNAMESQTISGIVATWAPKICTIIIAISASLTTNIIPHVTTSYVKKDYAGVNYRINQALSTMLVITIPMAVLLFLLSKEAYFIFYSTSQYGPLILAFSAISHIFFGIWSIFNSILQSLKKFKIIYLNSIIGLVTNALLDIPIILLLKKMGLPAYIGTVIATSIGYIVSILIVMYSLNKTMKFNYTYTINTLKKISIPIVLIIIVLAFIRKIVTFEYSIINAMLYLAINGIIGAGIYLVFTYKNKLLDNIFGENFLKKLLKK